MQLQYKLHNPRIECRLRLTECRRAQVVVQYGVRRSAGRRNRADEIRVIDQVERLRARHQAPPLVELEAAAERCVKGYVAGPAHRIAADVAECAQRVRSKGSGVDPLTAALMRRID